MSLLLVENTTQCFLLGITLQSGFASLCLPLSRSFAFHQGTAGPRPSQHHSDSNRMQCTEPLVPTWPLVGRNFFCLFLEGNAGWLDVHVGQEFPTAVC